MDVNYLREKILEFLGKKLPSENIQLLTIMIIYSTLCRLEQYILLHTGSTHFRLNLIRVENSFLCFKNSIKKNVSFTSLLIFQPCIDFWVYPIFESIRIEGEHQNHYFDFWYGLFHGLNVENLPYLGRGILCVLNK